MLVLTRKSQEQIRIGDDITISIIKVKGNAVRVGIEAPRDVRIIRGELPVFDTSDLVESEESTELSSVEDEPGLRRFVEARLANRPPFEPAEAVLSSA